MDTLLKSILLFLLNLLDAKLTIIWVRNGVAEEGNIIMAYLLECGNAPFLLTKVAIGAFATLMFYNWSHHPVARVGLVLSLGVYLLLMCVHAATSISTFI